MKRFRVRLVEEVTIEFDDERATEKSARYVAEKCWTLQAIIGARGSSRTVGNWNTALESAEITEIREVRK
jgi:hypothetical protein